MATTDKKSTWVRTSTTGLYQNSHSGMFYSRYSLNGKSTFRSLKTTVLTVAKILHSKRQTDIEIDRQRGVTVGSDFKTLGELLAETQKRLAQNKVAENTKIGRFGNIERLKKHWVRGNFETFLARNVTDDVITELREHLLHKAEWRLKFQKAKPHRGFSPIVVNQTLWILRVTLDIGVEKRVLLENPFNVPRVLREKLYAHAETRRRTVIPDRQTMHRIFAEMRRVPEDSDKFRPNAEQRVFLEEAAQEMADHAELLAYSGMRRDEAKVATLADDRGTEFKIHGTKSESSDRTIPVNPALRAVLDRYKAKRVGTATKLVRFEEPRTAMRRACKRLGLPMLKNHELRHYFASICFASGVDVPTVSRWLGHSDGGALAMKTYGHLVRDMSLHAANKVDFGLLQIAR